MPSPLSRVASAISALRHNQDLLRNAGSLAATTGITSGLGFAYWIYGARVFSPTAVGYASAAVSTMILLGTIGMFGLDTLMIGELPRNNPNRGGLVMAATLTAFTVSGVLGLGYCLVSLLFGAHTVEINGTAARMALFTFGVAVNGASMVFDAATIGLMRGGIQLWRNASQAVAKMAALPAVALVLHDQFGIGILLSWVLGTVASVLPVAVMIKVRGGQIFYRPDWTQLWRLRKLALAHNWLNLAINIPVKLIPVLVAAVTIPSANGAFYTANLVASILTLIPFSLSMVLFAVASASPEKIAEKLRLVLRMSLLLGVPAGLVMAAGAHLILSAFGSSYANLATGPLWILIVGYLPGIPNTVYIAVARAQGKFNQAAIFMTVFAALQMAALVVGAKIDGLYGLSFGMLAVTTLQATITTPRVLRAAFGTAGIRSTHAATAEIALDDIRPAVSVQQEREDSLAAFVSLARDNAMRITGANPAIINVTGAFPALTQPHFFPDLNEGTFRSRQEKGLAALIAIAENSARITADSDPGPQPDPDPQPETGAREFVKEGVGAAEVTRPVPSGHPVPSVPSAQPDLADHDASSN